MFTSKNTPIRIIALITVVAFVVTNCGLGYALDNTSKLRQVNIRQSEDTANALGKELNLTAGEADATGENDLQELLNIYIEKHRGRAEKAQAFADRIKDKSQEEFIAELYAALDEEKTDKSGVMEQNEAVALVTEEKRLVIDNTHVMFVPRSSWIAGLFNLGSKVAINTAIYTEASGTFTNIIIVDDSIKNPAALIKILTHEFMHNKFNKARQLVSAKMHHLVKLFSILEEAMAERICNRIAPDIAARSKIWDGGVLIEQFETRAIKAMTQKVPKAYRQERAFLSAICKGNKKTIVAVMVFLTEGKAGPIKRALGPKSWRAIVVITNSIHGSRGSAEYVKGLSDMTAALLSKNPQGKLDEIRGLMAGEADAAGLSRQERAQSKSKLRALMDSELTAWRTVLESEKGNSISRALLLKLVNLMAKKMDLPSGKHFVRYSPAGYPFAFTNGFTGIGSLFTRRYWAGMLTDFVVALISYPTPHPVIAPDARHIDILTQRLHLSLINIFFINLAGWFFFGGFISPTRLKPEFFLYLALANTAMGELTFVDSDTYLKHAILRAYQYSLLLKLKKQGVLKEDFLEVKLALDDKLDMIFAQEKPAKESEKDYINRLIHAIILNCTVRQREIYLASKTIAARRLQKEKPVLFGKLRKVARDMPFNPDALDRFTAGLPEEAKTDLTSRGLLRKVSGKLIMPASVQPVLVCPIEDEKTIDTNIRKALSGEGIRIRKNRRDVGPFLEDNFEESQLDSPHHLEGPKLKWHVQMMWNLLDSLKEDDNVFHIFPMADQTWDNLPEFIRAARENSELLEMVILLHDIGKLGAQRDQHAEDSAKIALKALQVANKRSPEQISLITWIIKHHMNMVFAYQEDEFPEGADINAMSNELMQAAYKDLQDQPLIKDKEEAFKLLLVFTLLDRQSALKREDRKPAQKLNRQYLMPHTGNFNEIVEWYLKNAASANAGGVKVVTQGNRLFMQPSDQNYSLEADLTVCLAVAAFNSATGEWGIVHILPTGYSRDYSDINLPDILAPDYDIRLDIAKNQAMVLYLNRLFEPMRKSPGENWKAVVLKGPDSYEGITAEILKDYLKGVLRLPPENILEDTAIPPHSAFGRTVAIQRSGNVTTFYHTRSTDRMPSQIVGEPVVISLAGARARAGDNIQEILKPIPSNFSQDEKTVVDKIRSLTRIDSIDVPDDILTILRKDDFTWQSMAKVFCYFSNILNSSSVIESGFGDKFRRLQIAFKSAEEWMRYQEKRGIDGFVGVAIVRRIISGAEAKGAGASASANSSGKMLAQEFMTQFPSNYALMLSMFGELVMKDESLKKYFDRLVGLTNRPMSENQALYFSSLLRIENPAGLGQYDLNYEREGEDGMIESAWIPYHELDDEFLTWAVRKNVPAEYFSLAYSLYLKRKNILASVNGPQTKIRIQAGKKQGEDLYEELSKQARLASREELVVYRGDVENVDRMRWIDLPQREDIKEFFAEYGIAAGDIQIGILESKDTYDIYIFTRNPDFIKEAGMAVNRKLKSLVAVGYAQACVIDGKLLIYALQPRFSFPHTVDARLKNYAEGGIRGLVLAIENQVQAIIRSDTAINELYFLTPSWHLANSRMSGHTAQHYYYDVPQALGYSLVALDEPMRLSGYWKVNFAFRKILPTGTFAERVAEAPASGALKKVIKEFTDALERVQSNEEMDSLVALLGNAVRGIYKQKIANTEEIILAIDDINNKYLSSRFYIIELSPPDIFDERPLILYYIYRQELRNTDEGPVKVCYVYQVTRINEGQLYRAGWSPLYSDYIVVHPAGINLLESDILPIFTRQELSFEPDPSIEITPYGQLILRIAKMTKDLFSRSFGRLSPERQKEVQLEKTIMHELEHERRRRKLGFKYGDPINKGLEEDLANLRDMSEGEASFVLVTCILSAVLSQNKDALSVLRRLTGLNSAQPEEIFNKLLEMDMSSDQALRGLAEKCYREAEVEWEETNRNALQRQRYKTAAADEAAADAKGAAEARARADGTQKRVAPIVEIDRVLVVDDEWNHYMLIKMGVGYYERSLGLESGQIDVVWKNNSRDALTALETAEKPFDLVISDNGLVTEDQPIGKDGEGFVVDIRKAQLKRQPIIILSTADLHRWETRILYTNGIVDAVAQKDDPAAQGTHLPPHFPEYLNRVLEEVAARREALARADGGASQSEEALKAIRQNYEADLVAAEEVKTHAERKAEDNMLSFTAKYGVTDGTAAIIADNAYNMEMSAAKANYEKAVAAANRSYQMRTAAIEHAFGLGSAVTTASGERRKLNVVFITTQKDVVDILKEKEDIGDAEIMVYEILPDAALVLDDETKQVLEEISKADRIILDIRGNHNLWEFFVSNLKLAQEKLKDISGITDPHKRKEEIQSV